MYRIWCLNIEVWDQFRPVKMVGIVSMSNINGMVTVGRSLDSIVVFDLVNIYTTWCSR